MIQLLVQMGIIYLVVRLVLSLFNRQRGKNGTQKKPPKQKRFESGGKKVADAEFEEVE